MKCLLRHIRVVSLLAILSLPTFGRAAPWDEAPAKPAGVAEPSSFAPEQALVYDIRREWPTIVDSRMDHLHAERFLAEVQPFGVRFTVEEPEKKGIWKWMLNAPFSIEGYPICVVTYRAWNVDKPQPVPSWLRVHRFGFGKTVLGGENIIDDGLVHEARFDLAGKPAEVNEFRFSLYSGRTAPLVLDLLQLRFEARPEAPAPTPREIPEVQVVVTAQGKPVPGATVTVGAERVNFARCAVTDDQGVARLIPLEDPTGKYTYRAEAPGFAPAQIVYTRKVDGIPVRLTLKPGVSYSAVVRDTEGRPVPDAFVHVNYGLPDFDPNVLEPIPYHPNDNLLWTSETMVVLRTDAEGRWRTPPLPDDLARLQMFLVKPEYIHAKHLFYFNAVPPIGQMRDGTAVITLRRGVDLTGSVVDEEGKPFANALIGLEEGQWCYDSDGRATDHTGRFRFRGMEPGYWAVFVKAPGRMPQSAVACVREGMAPLEFTLRPGKTILGRVVTPEGRPIAGALVRVHTWNGYHNPLNWHAFQRKENAGISTDAKGRFAWRNAPEDEVRFDVEAAGYVKVSDYPLTASEREYVIPMTRAPQFTATMIDAETKAPLAWRVLGYVQEAPSDDTLRLTPPTISVSPACARYLWAEAPGYLPQLSRALHDGEDVPQVVFEMKKAPAGTTTVLSPDGQPATNVEVVTARPQDRLVLRDGHGFIRWGDKAVDVLDYALGGVYRLRPFVSPRGGANRQHIHAWKWNLHPDRAFAASEGNAVFLPPTPENFPVVLASPEGCLIARAGDLTGRASVQLQSWGKVEGLLMIAGRPAAGQFVRLERVQAVLAGDGFAPKVEYDYCAQTGPDGRFVFERVPPGKVHVHQEIAGPCFTERARCALADVPAGGEVRVVLGATGRTLTGRLTAPAAPDGPPDWSLARVTLTPRDADDARPRDVAALVDADGVLRADNVEPGDYDLRVVLFQPVGRRWRLSGVAAAGLGRSLTVAAGAETLDLGVLPLRTPASLKFGAPAPDFSVLAPDGTLLDATAFRGKFLLLVFWSPRQVALDRDIGLLKDLRQKYRGETRLAILGLSLEGGAAEAQEAAARRGMDWPQCVPAPVSRAGIAFDYGLRQPLDVPTCVLISPEGNVAARALAAEETGDAVEWKLRAAP